MNKSTFLPILVQKKYIFIENTNYYVYLTFLVAKQGG